MCDFAIRIESDRDSCESLGEQVAVDFDDPVFDVGDGSVSGAVVGAFDAALKDGFGVLDHRGMAVLGEGHDELQAEVAGEGETGVDAVAGEFREGLVHDDDAEIGLRVAVAEVIDALEGGEHGDEEGCLVFTATLLFGAFVE